MAELISVFTKLIGFAVSQFYTFTEGAPFEMDQSSSVDFNLNPVAVVLLGPK